MKNKFDDKTAAQLKHYVYLLIDPRNDKPFYVGEGKNNRVFEHIRQDIVEDGENLKYDKIKEIGAENVKHIIVRHGLTKFAAREIEASLIDVFRFIPSFNEFVEGNIQGGFKSIERGLMTTDEIISIYNAKPLKDIGDECLIININQNYKRGIGQEAIYQATKQTWRMSKYRPNRYKYVLSEYKGIVREVFEVDEWYENERSDQNGKLYIGFGFNGKVAENKIRDKYINKNIKTLKPRGFGNPLIYPETLRRWIKENESR